MSVAPKKDLVDGEGPHQDGTLRVEHRQHLCGALDLLADPAADCRMIGGVPIGLGQEGFHQILDLPEADAHGEGSRGELQLPRLVKANPQFSVATQGVDFVLEPEILRVQFGPGGVIVECGVEVLFGFTGVNVDRLATAACLPGLLNHRAMLS